MFVSLGALAVPPRSPESGRGQIAPQREIRATLERVPAPTGSARFALQATLLPRMSPEKGDALTASGAGASILAQLLCPAPSLFADGFETLP